MKVHKVKIKNFKNIKDLEKEVGGNNLILLGDNGKGKSSFMQAIEIAAGASGNLPPHPITKGEDNAEISIIAQDESGNEYEFTAKFDGKSNKPSLTCQAPNGFREKRKTVIGSIVGEIEFDVFEFVELSRSKSGKAKQVEIVEGLLSEELQIEMRKLKNEIDVLFEDRTEINRHIKLHEGYISEIGINPHQVETFTHKKSVDDVQEKLSIANKRNNSVDKIEGAVKDNNRKIDDLKNELEELEAKVVEQNNWLKKHPRIDAEQISEELNSLSSHNAMVDKVNDYNKKEATLTELKAEAIDRTGKIDKARSLIEDTIKDGDFPVEGLSFGKTGELMYNGVEVDPSTMATSEIMHLGIQLKIAKNPSFKVMCIEHGESLGTERLKQIQELCEEHGYQIIMEQVERGTEELTIEIMGDPVKKKGAKK